MARLTHAEYQRRYRDNNPESMKASQKRYNDGIRASFKDGARQPAEGKCCSLCRLIKSAAEFRKNLQSKDGLSSWCKGCSNRRENEIRLSFKNGERERVHNKRCPLCRLVKPASEFYLSNTNKDGLHGWCKQCSDRRTTENGRKRLLGLTPEVYHSMYERQNGKCAICAIAQPRAGKRSFSADHDHKTGAVRGLLCTRCNTMLGNAADSISILRAAISYLEEWKQCEPI